MTMCGGLLYIIEEIKVKNIIIGKQYETCENYKKFINIVKTKKDSVSIHGISDNVKVYICVSLYLYFSFTFWLLSA